MNNIELFHQTYTYDTGNNLTNLPRELPGDTNPIRLGFK
jgi:hypothetical protein